MEWIVEPIEAGWVEEGLLAADVCNTKNICNTRDVCNTKNICNTRSPSPCGTRKDCDDKFCLTKGAGCLYRTGRRAPGKIEEPGSEEEAPAPDTGPTPPGQPESSSLPN